MDQRLEEIPKGYGVEVDVSSLVTQNMSFDEARDVVIAYCQSNMKPGIIEKTYADMLDFIDCLIDSKKLHCLLIESPPGLGKSYGTVHHLGKKGYEVNRDFVVVQGFITPLEFYKMCYDYRDKLIVIDDTESVLSSAEIESMLLAMLWNPVGRRIVNYASSTSKLDGRDLQFEFTGKIIILTNNVPKGLRAFKSRSYYYKFDITRDNRMKMMRDMARRETVPLEIVDFIESMSIKDMINLDFRLLTKINDIYTTKHSKWRTLGMALLLAVDDELRLVFELAEGGKPVKEQVKEFMKVTDNSRATFFRRRKELGLKEE